MNDRFYDACNGGGNVKYFTSFHVEKNCFYLSLVNFFNFVKISLLMCKIINNSYVKLNINLHDPICGQNLKQQIKQIETSFNILMANCFFYADDICFAGTTTDC